MGLFTPQWKIDAQNLVMRTNYKKLVVSDQQLLRALNMFVDGNMKVISDCTRLINETVNPDVFFSRLDTLFERVQLLCSLESINGSLFTQSPTDQLRIVRQKLPQTFDDLINRCWLDAQNKACSLKTSSAKQARFDKLFLSLDLYRTRMNPQNIDLITNLKSKVPDLVNCLVSDDKPIQHKPKQLQDSTADISKLNIIPDINLARALFASIRLGDTIPAKYKKQIERIQRECTTQQMTARMVVALCGEPSDIGGLELVSEACSWAGADYREKTILWTQKLLDLAGEFSHIEKSRRNAFRASILVRLGQALEGEYRFDEAMKAYQEAGMINPEYSPYALLADLLVKMGRFDDAVASLEAFKSKSAAGNSYPYPCLTDTKELVREYENQKRQYEQDIIHSIDLKTADILEKKARGYVFKPRKKKQAE